MSYPLLDNLANLLATRVASFVIGVNLFKDVMPNTPAGFCTAIILSGGPYDPNNLARRRSFQIQHRNIDKAAGCTIASSIHMMLVADGWNQLTGMPGRILPHHEFGLHVIDANNCVIYSMNYSFISTNQ